MEKVIRWNEPSFGQEEKEIVNKVIDTAYVNEGPMTKELEELFKKYLNVKYVIFTTSATAALFLAVKADALMKGLKDFEVIVPDLTMIATATSVGWAGGKVVLADVEKNRATIDIDEIEKKITKKTSAIIPVHVLGRAVDMDKLCELAFKYNLTVIEDAAGALGSKDSKDRLLGTIGKIGCFSLQSNKIVTCGQGGVIVTNDDKYYEIIRRLRDFGRLSNKEFLHNIEGYNLKFNDLSAALALAQFKKLENKKNMLITQFEKYKNELSDIKEIVFPSVNIKKEIPLWVDIIVNNRKELIDFLVSQKIYARECWPAVHQNPPYQSQGNDNDFPVSTFVASSYLWLPNGPAVTLGDISYICEKIKEFYKKKSSIGISVSKDKQDISYLMKTFEIAKNNVDKTINKAIGALIVKNNEIVGTGFRKTDVLQKEPYKDITYHAEHMALIQAGDKARNATLYTTLEPCTMRSKGPGWDAPEPCCKLIYEAGIKRVVVGILDEDFGGGGSKYLIDKGIEVAICEGIDKEKFKALVENINFLNEEARKLYEESIRKIAEEKNIAEIKNLVELKKLHEDNRGAIHLVKNLLEDEKEFTFLELKKGSARGGCLHSNNEHFVVIKGKIIFIHGEKEEILTAGDSRIIEALKPHAFISLEDSIVSEWGITTTEKEQDVKDKNLRERIDEINKLR